MHISVLTLSVIAAPWEVRVELVGLEYLCLPLPLQLLLLVRQEVILEPGYAHHTHHAAHDDSTHLELTNMKKDRKTVSRSLDVM